MTGLLHPPVVAAFSAFSEPLEGRYNHLYLCVALHPTTAIGAIMRPVALALAVPWLREDGSRATEDEIRAEWERVEAAKHLATKGARAFKPLCKLHLSEATIDRITSERLGGNAAALLRAFPDFAAWPAAAQLAAISMCWALGIGKLLAEFPKCCAALRRGDFAGAAAECKIIEKGNAGVIERNRANRCLFLAAAHQRATDADPSVLLWEPPAPPQIDRGAVLAQLDLSLRASMGEAIEKALAERRREGDG